MDNKKQKATPIISAKLENGVMLETVFVADTNRLVVFKDGKVVISNDYSCTSGKRLVPYSAGNNLIKNHVVLLPSGVGSYESKEDLVEIVRKFIHTYVDLPEDFEILATYYVLLSWVYDQFGDLPYLRLRGDYGTGKTRFLKTVGSLCYLPMFASGASSSATLFHMTDRFAGTLVLDEGDFRFSDMQSDVVKLLNNGNVAGFPVLRCVPNQRGEFNPIGYKVFGPKLVVSRGLYQDAALESRFITCVSSGRKVRKEIATALPETFDHDARQIRNTLLAYRFTESARVQAVEAAELQGLEPRVRQVFQPLFAIATDPKHREVIAGVARRANDDLLTDKSFDTPALMLGVVKELWPIYKDRLTVKQVASGFRKKYQDDYDRKITPKWVGSVLRKEIGFKTIKINGTYRVVTIDASNR